MPLFKSQNNDLFLAISEQGITPTELALDIVQFGNTRVSHKPSGYSFDVRVQEHVADGFYCFYTPGDTTLEEEEGALTWRYVVTLFKKWLTYLKREISQPDLWATLAQSHIPDTLPSDNSPFTEPERRAIEERIGQIRDYAHKVLPALEDQPEWGRRLEAKLDYLTASSEHVGRKDWTLIFIGTMVSQFFSGVVDAVAVRDFLDFAWRTMYQILPSLPHLD